MKNRILAVFAACMLALGITLGAAAPASAGNGTSNYYLTGGCHVGAIGGVDLKLSNWDNGANQTYHVGWTRSGVAYVVDKINMNGQYIGKSSDFYVNTYGHGRNVFRIYMHLVGSSNLQSCWTEL